MTPRGSRGGERGVVPRLVTRGRLLEYLGGISDTTLARWIKDGRVPGPVLGTTRWDLRAVEVSLNRASGLPTLTAANEGGDDPDRASRERLNRRFGVGRENARDRQTSGRA